MYVTSALLIVCLQAVRASLYYADLDALLKRFPTYEDDDVMRDASLGISLREPGQAVLRDEESLQHAQIGDGFQYISGAWRHQNHSNALYSSDIVTYIC